MFGRVAFSLLSVVITACAAQQVTGNAALSPAVAEPPPAQTAAAAPAAPSPLTTQALPVTPTRKPAGTTRQALADPPSEPAAPPVVEPPKTPPLPDDAEIYEQIIEESRTRYPGPCGCPYDLDRAGRKCGGRSAYSRAGGYSLYCYARDVPAELVSRRRAKATLE